MLRTSEVVALKIHLIKWNCRIFVEGVEFLDFVF